MATKTETLNRDEIAKWYAQRHLDTDVGVIAVHYLPANAPMNEIRFLEVNREITESTNLEPIDFGVDIGGVNPHTLLVLDVTPSQWDRIQSRELALPPGWSLDGEQHFERSAQ